MKTRKTIAVLAGASLLVFGAAFMAHAGWRMMGEGPCGPGLGQGAGHEMLLAHLDLTDQQKEQIEKVHDEGLSEHAKLQKEMMQLRNELEGEWLADEPSIATLRELTQQMGQLRTRAQLQGIEKHFAIRNLLTPEQRDHAVILMHRQGGHGCQGQCGPQGHRGRHGRGRGGETDEPGRKEAPRGRGHGWHH